MGFGEWGQVDEGDEQRKKSSELFLVSLCPFLNFFILRWCKSVLQKRLRSEYSKHNIFILSVFNVFLTDTDQAVRTWALCTSVRCFMFVWCFDNSILIWWSSDLCNSLNIAVRNSKMLWWIKEKSLKKSLFQYRAEAFQMRGEMSIRNLKQVKLLLTKHFWMYHNLINDSLKR